MSKATFSLRPIVFAAALSGLVGWGVALANTDYVGDLNGLTPVEAQGFETAYAKSGTLPKGYTSVYIAPVGVIAGQDEVMDDMEPEDRADMQDYLQKHLTKQLGKRFTLASAAGPGVLVVDAKFTALRSNKPTRADMDEQTGLDYGRSFGIGEAGVQIELRDGASGELLAALADHEEGLPLDINTNKIVQWGDAQQFSRDWAQDLAESLV